MNTSLRKVANKLVSPSYQANRTMKKHPSLLFLSSLATSNWYNVDAAFTANSVVNRKSSFFPHGERQLFHTSSHFLDSSKNIRNQGSSSSSLSSSYESLSSEFLQSLPFRKGDKIQVEVVRFGPLGASVEIIAHNSHNEEALIPEDEEPLAYGLILQREIGYFRASRGGVDVVLGEILPAYVDWVRDDGKVDVSLRKPGGKGKAEDLGKIIMEKLQQMDGNEIPVGDKSTPQAINEMFPGASKASFKRAIAALYKKKLVQPGPFATKLIK